MCLRSTEGRLPLNAFCGLVMVDGMFFIPLGVAKLFTAIDHDLGLVIVVQLLVGIKSKQC